MPVQDIFNKSEQHLIWRLIPQLQRYTREQQKSLEKTKKNMSPLRHHKVPQYLHLPPQLYGNLGSAEVL